LRQSRSAVANGLLERLGHALISTSANISGQPTCKSGIEAFGVLDGRVDLVLDGGLCAGPGNTTVDITDPVWKLIRQGAITEREVAECLG
jgi:L-threonylcarbamoyladenylate synthase